MNGPSHCVDDAIEGRARADQSLVRSLTPICSAGTPNTAAIAARASAPCRTSARDHRRCRLGL
jgi:hypothetical protein